MTTINMHIKFETEIPKQTWLMFRKPCRLPSLETEKSNMAARRPFWKWRSWKSIGFCLWPPSTCIWNLKLKFQSKLDLCSGNHVVYRQTDGRMDGQTDGQGESSIPPPSNFVGRGYNNLHTWLKVATTSEKPPTPTHGHWSSIVKIFKSFHENSFYNSVCKILTISSRPFIYQSTILLIKRPLITRQLHDENIFVPQIFAH